MVKPSCHSARRPQSSAHILGGKRILVDTGNNARVFADKTQAIGVDLRGSTSRQSRTDSNLELLVNMKTARTLGIKIPDSVLARANRVIQ
jgi:hypothetical protein